MESSQTHSKAAATIHGFDRSSFLFHLLQPAIDYPQIKALICLYSSINPAFPQSKICLFLIYVRSKEGGGSSSIPLPTTARVVRFPPAFSREFSIPCLWDFHCLRHEMSTLMLRDNF